MEFLILSREQVNVMHFVYALVDPRDQAIRYIGMSRQPEKRLQEHLGHTSHRQKYAWIQELKAQGLRPELKIIEKAGKNRKQAYRRESHWIRHYFEKGTPLFNVPADKKRKQAS